MRLSCVLLVAAVLGLSASRAEQVRTPRHDAPPSSLESIAAILRTDRHVPRLAPGAGTVPGYGKLPLTFEANHGQADGSIKFLARGEGYSLFLTSTAAVFAFSQSEGPRPSRRADAARLTMRFADGASTRRVVGVDELPGRVNYFIGRDPARWRTNVPTYAGIRYENLYPGIDLVYRGNSRQLEYDFIVAPGADPRAITLAFEGADALEIDGNGDLIVRVPGGEVRQKKPFIYQERDGVREAVPGAYLLEGPRHVAFQVAAYNVSRTLVIDPQVVYSTYLGGSGEDRSLAIAVDTSGHAYVAGKTSWGQNFSFDFPTTPGAFQSAKRSGLDTAFVAKLDASGSALVYSTFLGGGSFNTATAIAVDNDGNAYVTGNTCAPDFPVTPGAFQPSLTPGPFLDCDAFVTKLNASGSALVYSTYLGGSENLEQGNSIAVDSAGNAYVAGTTSSPDFPTTPGAFQATLPSSRSVFATKLNPSGSGLVYSTFVGRASVWFDGRIALDASGDAYVAFQRSVVKLNSTGTGRVYATTLQGGLGVEIHGLAVDSAGSAYVTGVTLSSSNVPSDFPTVNPIQPVPAGGLLTKGTTFVVKLDPTGSAPVYSTLLGGTPPTGPILFADQVRGIAVDAFGRAWVTGFTRFADFPTTQGAFQTSLRGPTDTFVARLDATGTVLLYSTYLGGDGEESKEDAAVRVGAGITLDPSGSAYVTGWTSSSNFPTTDGAFQRTFGGGRSDAFVTKISAEEARIPLQFVTFPASLPSLPSEGQVGVPYVGNIGIGGGQPPYTIMVVKGALPPGLRFGSPIISGSPSEALTALFTAQVRDTLGSLIEKDFQITIRPSDLPVLRVVPESVDFGSVRIGSSIDFSVTIVNASGGTLTGSVTPPDAPFSIVSGGSFGLGPGASQTTVIRLAPTTHGPLTAQLTVSSNGGMVTRTLTASGTFGAQLSVSVEGTGQGTVESEPAGIECGATCTAIFARGAVVQLTAEPDTSSGTLSTLREWRGCDAASGSTCSVTVDTARTITATFDPFHTVSVTKSGTGSGSVTSDPAGIDCGPSCAASYIHGTRVTVAAVATAGSLFSGWDDTVCGGAGDTCALTIDEPKAITARFAVARPDLTVRALAAGAAAVAPGARVRVTATVENRGGAIAPPSVTRYYLSADAVKDSSDRFLSPSQRVPALAPGESVTRIATLMLSHSLAPGRYTLLACANAARRLAESDESNNCLAAAAPLEIVAIVGPDLVVDEVKPASASIRAGNSLTITTLIRNQGAARSERSTTRYYLSADGSGAVSDRLPVGSRSLGRLAPGVTARATSNLRVPPTLPTGSYFVWVCVDDLRRVVETDEANNCGVSPTSIQVQGR